MFSAGLIFGLWGKVGTFYLVQGLICTHGVGF